MEAAGQEQHQDSTGTAAEGEAETEPGLIG